jgi:hypothetical protein
MGATTRQTPLVIQAGAYDVDIDAASGSRLTDAANPAPIPTELKDAAAEPPEGQSAIDRLSTLVGDLSNRTSSVEHAQTLVVAARDGRLTDPATVDLEVRTLLGWFERLDREGRFAEELRLTRTVLDLYALLRRWQALFLTLRSLVDAARRAHDPAAEAWALHELGTFSAAGGHPRQGEEFLEQAVRIRERIGDRNGLDASRSNLTFTRRTPMPPSPPPHPPWARILTIVGGAAVCGVAGFVLGYVVSPSDNTVTVKTTTSLSVSTSTVTANANVTIPTASGLPLITPTSPTLPLDGQALTVSPATWANAGSTVDVWYWCDPGGCDPPVGTGSTYALGSTDEGKSIRVVETGSNAGNPVTGTVVSPEVHMPAPVG